MVDILVQILARQAVGRNAVTQHAAQLVEPFHDRHLVPHELQVVRRRQAAGAAAYNGNLLARLRQALRRGDIAGILAGKALQAANVDGIVHHVAAAVRLAGMLADKPARRRERIIFADQLDRIFVPSVGDQGNVTRNVHMGRAGHAARHRLVLASQAGLVLHMLLVILPEALQAVQHHAPRAIPDGAVRRQVNRIRRALEKVQILLRAIAVEDLLQQFLDRPQAHAAGNTLAAALGMAHLHHRQGHIHGARTARFASRRPSMVASRSASTFADFSGVSNLMLAIISFLI